MIANATCLCSLKKTQTLLGSHAWKWCIVFKKIVYTPSNLSTTMLFCEISQIPLSGLWSFSDKYKHIFKVFFVQMGNRNCYTLLAGHIFHLQVGVVHRELNLFVLCLKKIEDKFPICITFAPPFLALFSMTYVPLLWLLFSTCWQEQKVTWYILILSHLPLFQDTWTCGGMDTESTISRASVVLQTMFI